MGCQVKENEVLNYFVSCLCQVHTPLPPPLGVTSAVLFMISANITTTAQVWMTGLKNHIGNPLKSVSALSFRPPLATLTGAFPFNSHTPPP